MAVDFWSLAVTIHEMLTTELVGDCHAPQLRLAELADDAPACDLLTRMLRVDRAVRLGCGEADLPTIQAHAFFTEHGVQWDALARKAVPGPLLKHLRRAGIHSHTEQPTAHREAGNVETTRRARASPCFGM